MLSKNEILAAHAGNTAAELESYYKSLGKLDDADLQAYKDAVYQKRIVERHDLDNKSSEDMGRISHNYTGVRGTKLWAEIRDDKRAAEAAARRVAKVQKRYVEWKAEGFPADWLEEINGRISFREI
jgi:hypothetical protein